MRNTSRSLVAHAAWLPLLAGLALPVPAAAQMAPGIHVDQTHTYTVELTIGPAEQMLSPGEAMMAKSGEVMVSGGPIVLTRQIVVVEHTFMPRRQDRKSVV